MVYKLATPLTPEKLYPKIIGALINSELSPMFPYGTCHKAILRLGCTNAKTSVIKPRSTAARHEICSTDAGGGRRNVRAVDKTIIVQ